MFCMLYMWVKLYGFDLEEVVNTEPRTKYYNGTKILKKKIKQVFR